MSWNTMEEHEEDDAYKWNDPKKVDKDNKFLLRIITGPAEKECILLKRNQLNFGQSEYGVRVLGAILGGLIIYLFH